MKMNALVIQVFLIWFNALTTQGRGKTKEYCLKKMGITKNQLKIMKQSAVPDPDLKCFYRCILEKNNLIANNKIIPGAFKKIVGPMISRWNLAQVESSCHEQQIYPESLKHECDFGYLIYKCYNSLTLKDLQKVTKKNGMNY